YCVRHNYQLQQPTNCNTNTHSLHDALPISNGSFDSDTKKRILQQLTEAEGLERFLHTKYVGQKRFSLEGGESFIASMDEVVNHRSEEHTSELQSREKIVCRLLRE